MYLSVHLACILLHSEHQKTMKNISSYISELLVALCTNGNFQQTRVLEICPIVVLVLGGA